MAATYDPTKLKEFGKDRMRFDLGDTKTADPLLQDEEIQIILDENPGNWKRAVLKCMEHIADKFSQEADVNVGPLKMSLQERAKFWADKINKMKREIAGMAVPTVAASAGGAGDTTGPYFRTGMHDNP